MVNGRVKTFHEKVVGVIWGERTLKEGEWDHVRRRLFFIPPLPPPPPHPPRLLKRTKNRYFRLGLALGVKFLSD